MTCFSDSWGAERKLEVFVFTTLGIASTSVVACACDLHVAGRAFQQIVRKRVPRRGPARRGRTTSKTKASFGCVCLERRNYVQFSTILFWTAHPTNSWDLAASRWKKSHDMEIPSWNCRPTCAHSLKFNFELCFAR